MPAGALVSADWHVEIRGTLTGPGTDYQLGPRVIEGLDVPQAKSNDVDLAHAAGVYQGRDYTGPRVISIDYAIDGNSVAASAGSAFVALSALWAASETDLPLHMRVPGFGHIVFTGRPRGLLGDLSDLSIGFVRAQATFFCGNPAYTVVP